MVETAKSSMEIRGTLDTGNIDKGFTRVAKGFEGVKGQAKSFGSDMQRVSSTVAGMAKNLIGLGIAGTGAMVGIASKAPAVAPAIAKMSVEFGKLTRSLGEALAPAFDKTANMMGKFVTWVDNNQDTINKFSMAVLGVAETVGSKIAGYFSNWSDEFDRFSDKIKKAKKEISEDGGMSPGTEDGLKFNVPYKGSTSLAVGAAVAAKTKRPLIGAAASGMTYGTIGQFEDQMEMQGRVQAGQDSLQATAQSFAPGKIGDFYAWLFGLFQSQGNQEDRKVTTLNNDTQSWG